MTLKKAEKLAEEEWKREEYYFGYDEVWEQLVEYTRTVQEDALKAARRIVGNNLDHRQAQQILRELNDLISHRIHS